MNEKILNLLNSIIPAAHIIVAERKSCFGGNYLKIMFAASDKLISNVPGQFPGCVSLNLNLESLELETQIFGGMGGQTLFRLPDKNDPKEQFLAYSSVRIPFRKPKKEEKNVLAAIEKFAQNWKLAIRENLDRIPHRELADWEKQGR